MQGPIPRKYGAETTINFVLFEADGVDFRVDAVHASGDIKIMKDEGAEATSTNGFTDEGTGYSLVLSATEMQAARIVLYIVDQTATKAWLDKSITIETYGHASAQHAFDLDTANVTLAAATHTGAVIPTVTTLTGHTAQTGDNYARLGAPSGASVSADVAANATHLTDIKGTDFVKDTHSLDDIQAFAAAILGDTDELRTDWADGGRLDLLLDDVPTTSEFEARTPTAAQLAYIVANAATGMPVTFTTSGGSTTAAVLNQVDGASGSATDDQYNGRLLVFTNGTLKGVVTDITDYDGGTTTATITAIPFAPTASHTARLI